MGEALRNGRERKEEGGREKRKRRNKKEEEQRGGSAREEKVFLLKRRKKKRGKEKETNVSQWYGFFAPLLLALPGMSILRLIWCAAEHNQPKPQTNKGIGEGLRQIDR